MTGIPSYAFWRFLVGGGLGIVLLFLRVGLACFALAAISLAGLEDTHGRDLDFNE